MRLVLSIATVILAASSASAWTGQSQELNPVTRSFGANLRSDAQRETGSVAMQELSRLERQQKQAGLRAELARAGAIDTKILEVNERCHDLGICDPVYLTPTHVCIQYSQMTCYARGWPPVR